jgi:hypothetical protein
MTAARNSRRSTGPPSGPVKRARQHGAQMLTAPRCGAQMLTHPTHSFYERASGLPDARVVRTSWGPWIFSSSVTGTFRAVERCHGGSVHRQLPCSRKMSPWSNESARSPDAPIWARMDGSPDDPVCPDAPICAERSVLCSVLCSVLRAKSSVLC